jgi:hypothetical protein
MYYERKHSSGSQRKINGEKMKGTREWGRKYIKIIFICAVMYLGLNLWVRYTDQCYCGCSQ